MKAIYIIAATATAGFSLVSGAQAESAGNLIGTPVVAAGNGISTVAAGHAGIAPVVNAASPTLEPATDGVTNALYAAGSGVTGTGQRTQSDGVIVGSNGRGRPLASVGATNPANQGRVVAALNGPR